MLKFVLSFFALVGASMLSLYAGTFNTISNGNWTNSSTWQNGQVPDPENLDGDIVNINHNVTVQNNNVKLIGGSELNVNGVSFTLDNGNLIIEDGDASFMGASVLIAHNFSIQVTTSNGSIEMIGCQVEVGQNFQNSEGQRYLEDVCLIVDESFQNAKGTDTLINVCAVIGDSTSGNFQNDSQSLMYIDGSEFHLPNGNFQNQSSATLTGNITAIWLENGDLQNSGTWTAPVANYCVSGQVTVASNFLPASQTCGTISAFFNPCSCSGGNGPDPLVANAVGADAPCAGEATGSVDLTVTDGTPPYTFAWSNGATTEDLANVPAGTYSVTVTDAGGQTATASATVNEPSPVSVSTTGADVTCNGDADGTATATASGGTAPYTFAWSNGSTSASISGLAAGTYSVTVTDANNCTGTGSATIGSPAALTASATGTDANCFGDADGSATATASGGTAPYSFSWSNGGSGASIAGLAAGTYVVTVSDANGCTATASATVAEPSEVAVAVSATDASCGQADGSAAATVTGGTAPYSIAWSTGATTASIGGLAAGTYSVTATDANGCEGMASVEVKEAASPDSCVIAPGEFRTQTQGGWGANPNGNNPGVYLHANFAAAFPNGLVVGCNNTVTLTTANAVTAYLPCGRPSGVLSQSYVDPSCLNNVLLSQLITATISVTFDAYDPNFGSSNTLLGDLVLASGPLAGLTVNQVLQEANNAVGGCGSQYSLSDLNAALTAINQNFVDGTTAGGDLICPTPCATAPLAPAPAPEALRMGVWPNPSNGMTNVEMLVPTDGDATLRIYGADGHTLVRTEHLGYLSQGRHVYSWDGHNSAASRVASGFYIIELSVDDQRGFVKVIRD